MELLQKFRAWVKKPEGRCPAPGLPHPSIKDGEIPTASIPAPPPPVQQWGRDPSGNICIWKISHRSCDFPIQIHKP